MTKWVCVSARVTADTLDGDALTLFFTHFHLRGFGEGYGFGAAFDFMGKTQYIELVASKFR